MSPCPFPTMITTTPRALPREMVNIFLAELHRLAVLFRSMSEEGLQCAFIAGLPEQAEQLISTSSQMCWHEPRPYQRISPALAAQLLCCTQLIHRPGAMSAMDPNTGRVTVSCNVKLPEVRMLSSEEPSRAIDARGRDTLPGAVQKMANGARIRHQSPPQSTCKWHAACEDCSN